MDSMFSVKDMLPTFTGHIPKKFLNDTGSAKTSDGKIEWKGNIYTIYPKNSHHSKITFTVKNGTASVKMDKRLKKEFKHLSKDEKGDVNDLLQVAQNAIVVFHKARAQAARPR